MTTVPSLLSCSRAGRPLGSTTSQVLPTRSALISSGPTGVPGSTGAQAASSVTVRTAQTLVIVRPSPDSLALSWGPPTDGGRGARVDRRGRGGGEWPPQQEAWAC